MTNPQDRLTRVENLVEENARAINSLLQVAQIHQNDIEALSRDTQGLKLEVRRLVEELRQGRGEQ